jgi:hypothetical protein
VFFVIKNIGREKNMEESATGLKKPSLLNTKKELLDAYQNAVKQLEEKSKAELRPQAIIETKKRSETIQKADELTVDAIVGASVSLKTETNKLLASLVERLETEIRKYGTLQEAVEAKKAELSEVYEIEKSATTLAALIESQRQKRQEFEDQVSQEKERLMAEIQETRAKWDEEVKTREAALKEKALADQKARDREREEYLYQFKREQKLEKDKVEDLRSNLEKELKDKKETVEMELSRREALIADKEAEFAALREKVARMPQDIEAAAAQAWKEAGENYRAQLKNREEILSRDAEGERNVLNTRIALLEKVTAEQNEKIKELSEKLDLAYQKVQDVALKAIEGASQSKSYVDLQRIFSDKTPKSGPDRDK